MCCRGNDSEGKIQKFVKLKLDLFPEGIKDGCEFEGLLSHRFRGAALNVSNAISFGYFAQFSSFEGLKSELQRRR